MNNMAELATKAEYLLVLEELFDTAMPCSKKFMKESFANFYYNTSAEVSPKAIETKEFEEVFNEILEAFFPKEDKLSNKKVFISIPITGQEELARERCENIKKIINENYPTCDVFTPFEVAPEKDMPDSYYMGKDVEQLLNCDVMIQMDGWEKSKGCTVEDCIAKTYSIPIIKENQILD